MLGHVEIPSDKAGGQVSERVGLPDEHIFPRNWLEDPCIVLCQEYFRLRAQTLKTLNSEVRHKQVQCSTSRVVVLGLPHIPNRHLCKSFSISHVIQQFNVRKQGSLHAKPPCDLQFKPVQDQLEDLPKISRQVWLPIP